MPWKNAPACLGKLAGALGGSPMARHPDPPRSSRNIIHKHFPELRPCKVEAFTSNDFQPTCGTIHDALTDTRAMAWATIKTLASAMGTTHNTLPDYGTYAPSCSAYMPMKGSPSTTTFRAERATVEGTTIPRDPRNKPTLHCEARPAPQQNTFPRDKATGETLLIDSTTTAPWLQPC
ncbi:hypothetical protein Lal_00048044 [Lupinus albus]|nr:hypothetical protein Lal_00048044 [Lupinus albus]